MSLAEIPTTVLNRNPHLKEYIQSLASEGIGLPDFHESLGRDLKEDRFNILYPVGDPIFITYSWTSSRR